MRNDLCDVIGISEKKMFGGLACMYAGHMVCGVHKDGAMFRVGKIPRGRGQSH
ncbi:MAG: TfoX/Sxy family protein [Paracoccaceae bacterium]